MRGDKVVYLSFLVRVWYTPTPEGGVWMGEVEHIQSGRRWQFNHLQDIGEFFSHPEKLFSQTSDDST